MVYTPTGEPFTIDCSSLRGKIAASWLNPLNGKYTSIGTIGCKELGKSKTFEPPTEDEHPDWVLVLEKARK